MISKDAKSSSCSRTGDQLRTEMKPAHAFCGFPHTALSSSLPEEETSARAHNPSMVGTLSPFCISHGDAEWMLSEKGKKCETLQISRVSWLLLQMHASQNQAFFHSIHSDQISFRTKLKSKSSPDQKNIILN